MRGKVARQLRQLTRQMFAGRPLVEYEYKEMTHGGMSYGTQTTRYMTDDCLRALYKGAKQEYRLYGEIY